MSFFGGSYPFAHPSGPGRRGPHHPANLPHGLPFSHGYNGFYGHPASSSPYEHFPTPYGGAHFGQEYPQSYGNPNGDIDEEERAAVAHLQAIQRRREAATAHATREAEIRAERELAFQAAVQREREARQRAIEAAAERQREQQREREAAIRRALAAQKEREEAERQRQVQQARQARATAVQQFKQRAFEVAKAKAYAYAQAAAQQAARQAAVAAQEKKRYWAEQAAQRGPTGRCTGSCARPDNKEQNGGEDGLEILNSFFGPLFGFQLARDDTDNAKPATEPKAEAASAKPQSPPKPVTEKRVEEPKSTEKKTEEPKSTEFPSEINDLLSQFLGVRVGPAGEGETATKGGSDKDVIGGLNQLLGQFGLEFEPSTPADKPAASQPAKASSSTQPTPASTSIPAAAKQHVADQTAKESTHHATPIADFLNGQYPIPPFVRDILGNVELALTQGQDFNPNPEPVVEGKGKGVAEGEKKARPAASVPESTTPVPAPSDDSTSSAASIDKLNTISHELFLAIESFSFPDHLTFAESSGNDLPPPLLFNKTNSPYHAQANKLLQLLLVADGIASGGDKDVRRKRKEVVSAVEAALEELEKKRDNLWVGVKDKREKGEESDHEESTSSAASTTSDIEHIELAEGTAYEAEAVDDETPSVEVTEPTEIAEEHENVDTAPESADDEVVFDAETDEVKPDEAENKEEKQTDDKPAPTGTSTPRSVTVEDQEEGYEVL